jgi:hypothetical protein
VQRVRLQAVGWSGRHPLGHRETRRILVGRLVSNGLSAHRLFVFPSTETGRGLPVYTISRAYPAGDLIPVLLLVGLMLLLLAFSRARDAAARRAVGGDPEKP